MSKITVAEMEAALKNGTLPMCHRNWATSWLEWKKSIEPMTLAECGHDIPSWFRHNRARELAAEIRADEQRQRQEDLAEWRKKQDYVNRLLKDTQREQRIAEAKEIQAAESIHSKRRKHVDNLLIKLWK